MFEIEDATLMTCFLTYDTEQRTALKKGLTRLLVYERDIRENTQARKRETNQPNTAKLTQLTPNMAAPWYRETAREKVVKRHNLHI